MCSGAFTNESGATSTSRPTRPTFSTVTNNAGGTVHVTNASVTWGNFTNNGAYISDPSTQTFSSLTEGSTGYINAAAGDAYQIKGDFINNSTANTLWNTAAAELDFVTGTGTSHTFALAGADMGQTVAGLTKNFAWGSLDITGQTLTLADGNSTPGAALYVGAISGLTFSDNTVTDITGDGYNIYYIPYDNPGLQGLSYNLENGGRLSPVPVPPSPCSWAPASWAWASWAGGDGISLPKTTEAG